MFNSSPPATSAKMAVAMSWARQRHFRSKPAHPGARTGDPAIAAAVVTIHPGGMREMHWHPNADEWAYIIAGEGQATMFNTDPNAVSQSFRAGDIGYFKRNFGYYLRNTGTCLPGGVPQLLFRRCLAFRLADPHAAVAGRPASQH